MNPSAIRPVNPRPVSHNQSAADCSSPHLGRHISRSSFFGDCSSDWNSSGRLYICLLKQRHGGFKCWDDSDPRYSTISCVLSLKDAKKSFNSKERVPPVFPVNLNSCFREWLSQLFHSGLNVEGKETEKPAKVEPQIGGFGPFPAESEAEMSLAPLQSYIIQSFNDSDHSPIGFTEVAKDYISARALAEVAITDLVSAIPSINALRTLPYFDMLNSNLVQAPRINCRLLEETPLSAALSSIKGRVQVVTCEDLGSADALASWLRVRLPSGIDKWGMTPGTKRVLNLWMELKEGEIVLEDDNPPRRTVHVASVKIRNKAGFLLVEAHQEMADGSIRHRNRPLSEKMRPGEDVEEACFRGISEELGSQLGARNRVRILQGSYKQKLEERESRSYPGLLTLYVVHSVEAVIDDLPETGFYTVENEMTCLNTMDTVVIPCLGPGTSAKGTAVGVKKHYWRWVPQAC